MAAKTNRSFKRLSITEEAHFLIQPLPRLNPEQIHRAYVRPLQNLLSFATDTPNAVEEIQLLGEKVVQEEVQWNRKYHLVYNPVFRLKTKKDHLLPGNMLFTFDETQDAGLNIFEKWMEFTRKHEAFCAVYFASLYAPPRYLDEKFLRLMSAFTLLTTSLGEVSQRTRLYLNQVQVLSENVFTHEEQALLGHVMPTGPEIEMPFHLLRLLEKHRSVMSQIIGDDLPGFVRSVSDTIALIERRPAMNNSPPIQGADLHFAMQKIQTLIKIVILKELGFSEELGSKFLERNQQFGYLKGL